MTLTQNLVQRLRSGEMTIGMRWGADLSAPEICAFPDPELTPGDRNALISGLRTGLFRLVYRYGGWYRIEVER